MEVEKNNEQYNSVKAWQKLHARLEADNLLEPKTDQRLNFGTQSFLKLAAAVAFILVLTGLGVLYLNKPQLVQIASNVLQTTKVAMLPDGTSVYLAYGSTITYPKNFKGKTRQVELQGEAFFDVAKNPQKPFIITTSRAMVKVLGTSFNLKADGNSEVELDVLEGRVSIELLNSPASPAIAIAGDYVVSENNKLLKSVTRNTSPREKIVKMQFQDETLQQIVAVINRVYGSNIVIEGAELQNKVISVMFENNLNSIVDVLSQSFGLQKDEMPDGRIILSH